MSAIETPREIFLDACEKVAASLAPFAFKYTRSRQCARRSHGDFDYRVSFQSSHLNVGGHYVALWIHATVSSRRLESWRSAQSRCLILGGAVAGGQIGNLLRPHSWRDWNLALAPEVVIADAISAVHAIAVPFFERFSDVPTLCSLLQREELPGFHISRALEFLLCFDDREAAEQALHSFFRSRAELLPEYRHYLLEFTDRGLPAIPRTGFAYELAFSTVAFGLAPPK